MLRNQLSNSCDISSVPEQLCRHFSLAEMIAATNNFNSSFVVGQGSSGEVYKGEIEINGVHSRIAIKKSKSMAPEIQKEFRHEILMVSKFKHSNLASLIGYCETDNEMMLIYEYMAGGTLAENLHFSKTGSNNVPLNWIKCLKLCIGAARGLHYLHTATGTTTKVIHRDVKSSNILLDGTRATAKISDFGMSKIGPANQGDTSVRTRVVGTIGYLDPDYYTTGLLTSKSDVYAFGVVLFEVLCGRPVVNLGLHEDERGLSAWARLCVEKGRIEQIIDPNLKPQIVASSLSTYVNVADKCLNARPGERPTMTEVVVELVLALSLQENGRGIVRKSAHALHVRGSRIADRVRMLF